MLLMRLRDFHMSQTEIDSELNSAIKAFRLKSDIARPYQQEVVEQVLNIFKQHARTHIVMACGTGKTRVALWVAEQLGAKNIVVFVPSLALVNQFMQEWLKVTIWPRASCLAVCSDETVTRGIDSIIVDPEECDFPVTTNPEEIHQFLKNTTDDVRLVFCTYHSSAVLAQGMQGCPSFDYGVFDEAHKTAGNNHFGLALDNQALSIQKRLFMTATPKHCNINKKNQEGEARLAYSMDSEALYGPRAYTLSFRKAINLGIITDYKIMISVVSTKHALTMESELAGKMVALRKAALKDPNIAKVITFHKTIKEAYAFSTHIQGKRDLLGFSSLHVSSLMPSHSRKNTMRTFQESDKSIISNARCLTEGIDVPAIDMVAFLNAKKSKIDIVQAIGRAMRKAPGKVYGYVFLPLFVDQNKGESIEDAILRADYGSIWEVVQALSEQDEDLQATIEELKQAKGKTGELAPGLERYLDIITQDDVNIRLQEQLKRAISIAIIDKIASNWYEMYGKLILFKEWHHHSNVSETYKKNKPLGKWVTVQRQNYKNNRLSANKLKLLDAIGFEWNPLDANWHFNYEALKAFKIKNNDCNVPVRYEQNKALGHWVSVQRKRYKNNRLSENKIKLLDTIEFEWNPLDTNWHFNYEALKVFKEQNNHCNVPWKYKQNKRLASWINTQRQDYRNNRLSENKLKLLDAIGFEWNLLDANWQFNYEALKLFKEQNNHCNVPLRYQKNKCLANWVAVQRKCYKNNKLSENKLKLLDAIGFEWNPLDANWHFNYEALKLFKEQNNHCNVSLKLNKDLRYWVSVQRRCYQNNKISEKKLKLLNAVGFEWNPLDANWHCNYEALKAFQKQNNHCNIPFRYQKNKCLVDWVTTQRQDYKNNRLSENKIKLLNAIGFEWKPLDTI
ncbi:MAG TPA: Helicase associated domain protein [Gammaproteobacteria bacterium]|nr:Helicase associated domain protein [Gammaproteobacteria bacterium]